LESLDRDFTGNSAGKRHSFHKGPRKRWCFHIVSENQPNNNNDNSNNNDNNNSNNNNSNNHDDDDDDDDNDDDDDEHHFFSDGFNMFLETADGFNITWHRGYIVVVLYIYMATHMGIKTQSQDVGEERSGPKDFITWRITGWTADLIRPRPS